MPTIEESIAEDIYNWRNSGAEIANRPMEMIYRPIERKVNWEEVLTMLSSLHSVPQIGAERSLLQASAQSPKAYTAEAGMADAIEYRKEFSSRVYLQLKSEVDAQSRGWHQERGHQGRRQSLEPVNDFDEKVTRLQSALAYAEPDLVAKAFERVESIRNIKVTLQAATDAATNTVMEHAEKWYNAHTSGVSRLKAGHFEAMGELTKNAGDFMNVLNRETRNLRIIGEDGDRILRKASSDFDDTFREVFSSAKSNRRPRPAEGGSRSLNSPASGARQMEIKIHDFAYAARIQVPGAVNRSGRNTPSAQIAEPQVAQQKRSGRRV